MILTYLVRDEPIVSMLAAKVAVAEVTTLVRDEVVDVTDELVLVD